MTDADSERLCSVDFSDIAWEVCSEGPGVTNLQPVGWLREAIGEGSAGACAGSANRTSRWSSSRERSEPRIETR